MRKLILPLLLFMWIFMPVVSHAANIVDNASFEGPLGSWSVTGYYTLSMVYHYDGGRSLLGGSGNSPTTVSQTIATTPGGRYALSFWMMNLSASLPVSVTVSWGPETVLTLTDRPLWIKFADVSEQWQNFTVPVLEATGTSTTLAFTMSSGSGLCLDLVSLEPISADVPEPASAFCLLGTGLVALSIRRLSPRLRLRRR